MQKTAFFVIFSLLWTTTFAPAALAFTNDVQSLRERGGELMGAFESAGWHLEDNDHQRLSTEQWISGAVTEYDMVPPAHSKMAAFVFHVRTVAAKGKLAKIALSVRNHDGAIQSRRAIEIDPNASAVDVRLRLEQTAQSMSNDLARQASAQPRTLWQRLSEWLIPSAYAQADPCLLILEGVVAASFFTMGYWLYTATNTAAAYNDESSALVAMTGVLLALAASGIGYDIYHQLRED